MSLELIKEAINVSRAVGEETTQTVIENDIIVPDIKPDIANILLLDGDVCVNSAQTMQDKVLINGAINFKILYTADDEEKSVRSINTSAGFTHGMSVSNSRQGMKNKVRCAVEHFEYNVLNGRKVNIKTIVSLNGKVFDEQECGIVNDFRGIDDVQVLKENVSLNSYLGRNDASCKIEERLEVPAGKPAIREILRSDIKITGKDYKITDNKIIAKGELNVATLYIGDEDQRIQFMEHEIPFTQFVDLENVNEDSICNVDYRIAGYEFNAAEDSDGELRILNGEATLNITAEGFDKRNFEIISDAYSPRAKLSLEKEAYEVEEVVAANRSQIVLKDTVSVSEDSPEVTEVFNVLCKPILTDCRVADDKVVIEGVVNSNVLYLADSQEQPIVCQYQDIPFKQSIDVRGISEGMGCDADLDIEHCTYSMVSSSEVEVRLVMNADIKVMNNTAVPLISKALVQPLDDTRFVSQPSLTIYFAQQGDDLWKVAKQYYTTMDDIRKINSLADGEAIQPGQQILIPRKA